MSPRRLLAPTCAALALVAVLPESAGAVGASAYYKVSVQGQVTETWGYAENADGYSRDPHYEGSGRAVGKFTSPKPRKLRISSEKGIIGRVPIDVSVQRQGTRRSFYRDPECGRNEQVADSSGCGTVSYRASAGGFQGMGR